MLEIKSEPVIFLVYHSAKADHRAILSSGGQPGYGSANGDDTFGDYDGSAVGSPAIPGYGAPGGDGGFPPLNSYNRKSRQLGEIDIQQVIEDLEIETGAETLEEEYGEY